MNYAPVFGIAGSIGFPLYIPVKPSNKLSFVMKKEIEAICDIFASFKVDNFHTNSQKKIMNQHNLYSYQFLTSHKLWCPIVLLILRPPDAMQRRSGAWPWTFCFSRRKPTRLWPSWTLWRRIWRRGGNKIWGPEGKKTKKHVFLNVRCYNIWKSGRIVILYFI